jgi:hypothetical protein
MVIVVEFKQYWLGIKFDFIIIHESGHDGLQNNITYKILLICGFMRTNYSERSLFYWNIFYGKKAEVILM